MKEFSSKLQHQSLQSWQKFIAQHGEYVERLSKQQLSDFQKAIALSDFIFNSAMQAPDLVINLFNSSRIYDQKCPEYHNALADLLRPCVDESDLHRALRRFRLQEMVHIAFADLILDIPLESSLERLSLLADNLIVLPFSNQ